MPTTLMIDTKNINIALGALLQNREVVEKLEKQSSKQGEVKCLTKEILECVFSDYLPDEEPRQLTITERDNTSGNKTYSVSLENLELYTEESAVSGATSRRTNKLSGKATLVFTYNPHIAQHWEVSSAFTNNRHLQPIYALKELLSTEDQILRLLILTQQADPDSVLFFEENDYKASLGLLALGELILSINNFQQTISNAGLAADVTPRIRTVLNETLIPVLCEKIRSISGPDNIIQTLSSCNLKILNLTSSSLVQLATALHEKREFLHSPENLENTLLHEAITNLITYNDYKTLLAKALKEDKYNLFLPYLLNSCRWIMPYQLAKTATVIYEKLLSLDPQTNQESINKLTQGLEGLLPVMKKYLKDFPNNLPKDALQEDKYGIFWETLLEHGKKSLDFQTIRLIYTRHFEELEGLRLKEEIFDLQQKIKDQKDEIRRSLTALLTGDSNPETERAQKERRAALTATMASDQALLAKKQSELHEHTEKMTRMASLEEKWNPFHRLVTLRNNPLVTLEKHQAWYDKLKWPFTGAPMRDSLRGGEAYNQITLPESIISLPVFVGAQPSKKNIVDAKHDVSIPPEQPVLVISLQTPEERFKDFGEKKDIVDPDLSFPIIDHSFIDAETGTLVDSDKLIVFLGRIAKKTQEKSDDGPNKYGAIYIHCRGGKARSAILTALYLSHQGMSLTEALEAIRHKRKIKAEFSSDQWDGMTKTYLQILADPASLVSQRLKKGGGIHKAFRENVKEDLALFLQKADSSKFTEKELKQFNSVIQKIAQEENCSSEEVLKDILSRPEKALPWKTRAKNFFLFGKSHPSRLENYNALKKTAVPMDRLQPVVPTGGNSPELIDRALTHKPPRKLPVVSPPVVGHAVNQLKETSQKAFSLAAFVQTLKRGFFGTARSKPPQDLPLENRVVKRIAGRPHSTSIES